MTTLHESPLPEDAKTAIIANHQHFLNNDMMKLLEIARGGPIANSQIVNLLSQPAISVKTAKLGVHYLVNQLNAPNLTGANRHYLIEKLVFFTIIHPEWFTPEELAYLTTLYIALIATSN